MSDLPSPDYRSLIIAAVILAVIGWLGLYLLLSSTLPTVGPRWLFFFLWTLAITGTALPFVWLLHRRFGTSQPAPPSTLLRQGLWIGLYTTLCIDFASPGIVDRFVHHTLHLAPDQPQPEPLLGDPARCGLCRHRVVPTNS
jgi:hypothetical protein